MLPDAVREYYRYDWKYYHYGCTTAAAAVQHKYGPCVYVVLT